MKKPSELHPLDKSPENSYLRDLVHYMNVLIQNASSRLQVRGKEGLVRKLEKLINSSTLPPEVSKRIRKFHLNIQKDSSFKPESLLIDDNILQELNELCKSLENEESFYADKLHHLAKYIRALVVQHSRTPEKLSSQAQLKEDLRVLAEANPLHSRLELYFVLKLGKIPKGQLDFDEILKELKSYWDKSEQRARERDRKSAEDRISMAQMESILETEKDRQREEAVKEPESASAYLRLNEKLMTAVLEGNAEYVQIFVDNGADPTFKDKSGKSPLDCARELGDTAIIQILEARAKEMEEVVQKESKAEARQPDMEASTKRLFRLGVNYLKQGTVESLELAKQQFLEVLKIDPDDIDILNNLGVVYARQDDFDPAEKCFRKVIELDEMNQAAHTNLDRVLALKKQVHSEQEDQGESKSQDDLFFGIPQPGSDGQQGEPKISSEAYKDLFGDKADGSEVKPLELDKGKPTSDEQQIKKLGQKIEELRSTIKLGRTVTGEKDIAEAAEEYVKIITAHPGTDSENLCTMAVELRELWEGGLIDVRLVHMAHIQDVRLHPNSFEALAEYGKTFFKCNTLPDLERAKQLFEGALKIKPNKAEGYEWIRFYLQETIKGIKNLQAQSKDSSPQKDPGSHPDEEPVKIQSDEEILAGRTKNISRTPTKIDTSPTPPKTIAKGRLTDQARKEQIGDTSRQPPTQAIEVPDHVRNGRVKQGPEFKIGGTLDMQDEVIALLQTDHAKKLIKEKRKKELDRLRQITETIARIARKEVITEEDRKKLQPAIQAYMSYPDDTAFDHLEMSNRLRVLAIKMGVEYAVVQYAIQKDLELNPNKFESVLNAANIVFAFRETAPLASLERTYRLFDKALKINPKTKEKERIEFCQEELLRRIKLKKAEEKK